MQGVFRVDPQAVEADTLPQAAALTQAPAQAEPQVQAPTRVRARGLFLLCGFAFGVLVGEVWFGGPFPAALVGLMAGLLVEFLYSRH